MAEDATSSRSPKFVFTRAGGIMVTELKIDGKRLSPQVDEELKALRKMMDERNVDRSST